MATAMATAASVEITERLSSSFLKPSITSSSVPAMVRMISGRKRNSSAVWGKNLVSMVDHLRGARWLGPVQNCLVRCADGRQEGLGVNAHPDHERQQRQNARPLAALQIMHVMPDLVRCFAEERSLIHPEHVAGGENHAGGGEDRPPDV